MREHMVLTEGDREYSWIQMITEGHDISNEDSIKLIGDIGFYYRYCSYYGPFENSLGYSRSTSFDFREILI